MRTTLPARERRAETPGAVHAVGSPADPWDVASRTGAPGGRRSVPHLLLGILLVLICAVGALALTLQLGGTRPVLATARAVTVGQLLTAADVRQVVLPADSDVRAIDAGSAASLIGRPLAHSLPPGALLTPESFGGAAAPPTGQAVVAVALDAGRLPLEVAPGDSVSVVAAPADGTDRAVPRAWSGVVTSVEPSDTGQLTVVSVQLAEAAAREVAAVPPGRLAVVLVATGG